LIGHLYLEDGQLTHMKVNKDKDKLCASSSTP
jgi:hypothetical protein